MHPTLANRLPGYQVRRQLTSESGNNSSDAVGRDVYCSHMKRTQIYISEEQDRRIARRAADAGASKAEIIRRLLDRGLGIDDGAEVRLRAVDETFGILPEAPDWPEWLAQVRGVDADERLRRLGR